jgi:hypothetical protein
MTKHFAVSLYLAAAVTVSVHAQQAAPAAVTPTPAEIAIHKAQSDIAKDRTH